MDWHQILYRHVHVIYCYSLCYTRKLWFICWLSVAVIRQRTDSEHVHRDPMFPLATESKAMAEARALV